MVQKNYCDICGKELDYQSWLIRFILDKSNVEDTIELIQLCNQHKKDISRFVKSLKRSHKTGESK